jgi:hypothetical protein
LSVKSSNTFIFYLVDANSGARPHVAHSVPAREFVLVRHMHKSPTTYAVEESPFVPLVPQVGVGLNDLHSRWESLAVAERSANQAFRLSLFHMATAPTGHVSA